jgi:hypothetical protein
LMTSDILTAILLASDVLTAAVMNVDILHIKWLSISRRQGVQDRLLHSALKTLQFFETSRTSHETTRCHTLEERSDEASYIFLTRE